MEEEESKRGGIEEEKKLHNICSVDGARKADEDSNG